MQSPHHVIVLPAMPPEPAPGATIEQMTRTTMDFRARLLVLVSTLISSAPVNFSSGILVEGMLVKGLRRLAELMPPALDVDANVAEEHLRKLQEERVMNVEPVKLMFEAAQQFGLMTLVLGLCRKATAVKPDPWYETRSPSGLPSLPAIDTSTPEATMATLTMLEAWAITALQYLDDHFKMNPMLLGTLIEGVATDVRRFLDRPAAELAHTGGAFANAIQIVTTVAGIVTLGQALISAWTVCGTNGMGKKEGTSGHATDQH